MLLDAFFPKICVFCLNYSKYPLCPKCRGKVIVSSETYVENTDFYTYGRLYCYGKYVGLLRERFISFKFKKEMWLGNAFGSLMYDSFERSLNEIKPSLVTFVPVSRNRFKERGFNQSEELAKGIARKLGIDCVSVLSCIENIGTQSKLSRKGRFSEVKGRFIVNNPDALNNVERILLIDDIFTTGATLGECALRISSCGVKTVDSMVFASGRNDIG